jgi:hypothetical protein
MGKFPVVSITLKGVDGLRFESATEALRNIIGNEVLRFNYLKTSDKLTLEDKNIYILKLSQ